MIPLPSQTGQLPVEAGLSLSDLSDIANVIVASLAFGFSIYSFWVQRERDRKSQYETEQASARNTRLQWYKDLVITPNIAEINKFYHTLDGISDKITKPDLDDTLKSQLITEIKAALRLLRKTFVDSIFPINTDLHNKVLECLDLLIDELTNAIDNDTLKLSNPTVREKHIGDPIKKSKLNILTLIYSYRGE